MLIQAIKRFGTDQDGATAIEYGLIAALIAVLALLGIVAFGDALRGLFSYVSNNAGNAMSGG